MSTATGLIVTPGGSTLTFGPLTVQAVSSRTLIIAEIAIFIV